MHFVSCSLIQRGKSNGFKCTGSSNKLGEVEGVEKLNNDETIRHT